MASKTQRDLMSILQDKEASLETIELQVASLQADIDALRRALAMVEQSEIEDVESTLPAKEMRNLMVEILREEGHGLHYGEIYDRLIAQGVTVPGKDPRRNVGAHLSNDDRFEKLGEGLWGLVSWSKSRSDQSLWNTPVSIVGKVAG